MSTQSTLNCPQCQEAVSIALKDFAIVGCGACGWVMELKKDGKLKATHSSPVVKPEGQEPFHLGSQIQYRKVIYTVASVFVYAVEFEEWDAEDSKWVKGKGLIKEWYAYDDQEVQLLMVIKDTDGKFYVAPNPVPVQINPELNKKNSTEYGQYELMAFAGIDKEPLELKGYYRFHGLSRLECANEKFENAPILKYLLTRLSPTQVKRMVIIDDLEKLKATEDFVNTTFYRNIFLYALLAILCLMIANLASNKGRIQRSPLIEYSQASANEDLDTVGFKPKLAGTFYLAEGKNYQLTTDCFLGETNQYIDYSLTLVRVEDAAVVADVALSFYTESGRDDEGYWEENLLHDQFKFQAEKTGKYQAFVAPDYENLRQSPAASLAIQVEPTHYTLFYLWSSAFFLLLFLIFQWRRENLVAFANLPHDTILHDIYESFS